MPNAKDLIARAVNVLHRSVFRASKGRVAARGMGMTVLELTTTGRRSGQPRKTMLTSPVHDEKRVVLVASYGGDDRHPAWFLNLRDNPDVSVMMEGSDRAMKARVATPEEKAELWPQVITAYKGYAAYQRRTDRDIPLVLLEPV